MTVGKPTQQKDIGSEFLGGVQSCPGVVSTKHLVTGSAERIREHPEFARVVVHYKNFCFLIHMQIIRPQ